MNNFGVNGVGTLCVTHFFVEVAACPHPIPPSLSLATLCSLLTHATRQRRQPQPNAFHVFKRRVLCTPPSLRGAIQSGTCAYLARRGEGQKADDSDDDRCDSSISNYAAAATALAPAAA